MQHTSRTSLGETDIKDAQWISSCCSTDWCVPVSFLLSSGTCRTWCVIELTSFAKRVNLDNRVQKVLEAANIKLGCVASDVMGASGRALQAICGWANQPRGDSRVSEKDDCITNGSSWYKPDEVRPHHRFILAELLCQIDSINERLSASTNRLRFSATL